LADFLRTVEEGNPCVCVRAITIASQAATPSKHRIECQIAWPVWRDPKAVPIYEGGDTGEPGPLPPVGGRSPRNLVASLRSSAPGSRDPFCPIARKPTPRRPRPPRPRPEPKPKPKPKPDSKSKPDWAKALARINIQTVQKGHDGKYVAIIDKGGMVKAGDTIAIRYRGLTYTWRVTAISEKGLATQKLKVTE
jgi:hypothetical protein